MDWIKRNLFFVIGSAAALVLMLLAAFYLYSGLTKNNEALEKLNAEYAELMRLNDQKPHPGNDKIDNIKAAREQAGEVRAFVGRTAKVFEPIPAIPASPDLNNAMLAGALRRTVDKLRKDAANGGVQLATNYYFSFTAQKDRIMFDQAGLKPLATQLGEVKVICDVLFAARINALDNIRREKISAHDNESQQLADYLDRATVTNDLAVISPYEVSIRCFSSELAGVLSGFASSPHCLIVKAINVEPAVLGSGLGGESGVYGGAGMPGRFGAPVDSTAALYGMMPDGGAGVRPPAGGAYVPPARGATARGGLPTLLDEKQLKVTMLIEVVKLTAKK
jgi:hypothetical protein